MYNVLKKKSQIFLDTDFKINVCVDFWHTGTAVGNLGVMASITELAYTVCKYV